jgi:membrane AbrB-like protein
VFEFPGGQAAAFCAVFAAGAVGYFIFRFLRIPNPALLGSMAVTGALNAAGLYPPFDTRPVSFIANVMIGVMIGRQIDRTVVERMAGMIRLVAIQTVGMLLLSLACGVTMRLTSGAELATSLISGAAGGIAEMIAFGMSIDADVSVIAFIQVFRVVIFLAMIPYLSIVAEKITGVPDTPKTPRGLDETNETKRRTPFALFAKKDYTILVPLALAGGAIAARLGVPAGAMLGAMFAGGGLSLFIGRQYKFDNRIRFAAQIGLGLATGERITPQIVRQLGTLFFPALVVTLVMLAGCTLLAILLYKETGWSLTTCLLCSAPAGLSQIASFAEEIGADPLTASVFHTARIVGIVTFYPWLVLPLSGSLF